MIVQVGEAQRKFDSGRHAQESVAEKTLHVVVADGAPGQVA